MLPQSFGETVAAARRTRKKAALSMARCRSAAAAAPLPSPWLRKELIRVVLIEPIAAKIAAAMVLLVRRLAFRLAADLTLTADRCRW